MGNSLCMGTSEFWSYENKEKDVTGYSTKLSLVSKKGYIGLLLTLGLLYCSQVNKLAKINNKFFFIIQDPLVLHKGNSMNYVRDPLDF